MLSPGFIIFLDVSHLGLVMLLLAVSVVCVVNRWPWVAARGAACR